MGFSTHLGISGNPEFEVNIKSAPLDFQLGGEASLALSSGPISGHVEQIPIQVRVPFMKHNHGYVVAASIGPFGMHLHEINATVELKVPGSNSHDNPKVPGSSFRRARKSLHFHAANNS